MSDVTVKQFADVVGIPVVRLMEQLAEAGMPVQGADQVITEKEKTQLLSHLRATRGQAGEPQRITLTRKTTSELHLSGAQGRSKTVTVEVRKKRTFVKQTNTPQDEETVQLIGDELLPAHAVDSLIEESALSLQPMAEESRSPATETAETSPRVEDRTVAKSPDQESAQPKVEPVSAVVVDAQAAAETRQAKPASIGQIVNKDAPRPKHVVATVETLDDRTSRGGPQRKAIPPKKRRVDSPGDGRQAGRYGYDDMGDHGGKSKRKGKQATKLHGFEMPTQRVIREVAIPPAITVGELAQKMAVKASEVIKALFNMGVMATINQNIDQDTATLVVEEMGHIAKPLNENQLEEALLGEIVKRQEGEAEPRPVVVTVMGHVDHGKTTLLDYIRRTRVALKEAGGITQHIGAYHVETTRGVVTFLDTPGHQAFTSMRARGAQITDIVILVVAADDSVMPQTIEAIQHARAANVPIVVAINKIDKPGADLDRVRNELAQHNLIPEAWGGDTMFCHVSAKTGEGVEELLESLAIQAEVMELRAFKVGPATGVVIESSLEAGRGTVATVLVKEGTLVRGDVILCGQEWGRVRAMFDENGRPIKEAGPSIPVQVLGLSGAPSAGDTLLVVEDERKARDLAEQRRVRSRNSLLTKAPPTTLEDVFQRLEDGKQQTLTLVIKADVHGSVEALRDALTKLSNSEVMVRVVSSGVGGITESDVNLAIASNASVIGFNVRADGGARRLVQENSVGMRYYSIIYEAIEDVRNAITGLMKPVIREEIIGIAEVRDVFHSSKLGHVAGCLVLEGVVRRSSPIRVLRSNVVVFEGELESLRRFKDDVSEVRSGTECGIGVKNYNDVRAGDSIEVFERHVTKPTA